MPRLPPPNWVITRRRAIGTRIRMAREHANLTQDQVVERSGIDRPSISRIENGHQAATIDTLILIADAIGVDLADLVRT